MSNAKYKNETKEEIWSRDMLINIENGFKSKILQR